MFSLSQLMFKFIFSATRVAHTGSCHKPRAISRGSR